MITDNQKISFLVPNQLPEFIRDNPDYSNFVLFLKAYYEWMEQEGNIIDRTKNILNYKDIDRTTSEFISYYINDFLPYFPQDTLIDEAKAVKLARQLYYSKGTPASYEFLFKVLYNSSFDVFFTKDIVLKASDGDWYISKSLKLSSGDVNFLNAKNLRIFGETTKSIATIENAVLAKGKIELFISNIERLFNSGEFVRVVDNNNQDVLFNGQVLRAKILGQISQVNVNAKNRGLLYQVGDPVVVYNGLSSNTGIGATAQVSETTSGAVKSVTVLSGGYGYSLGNTVPANTFVEFGNLNDGAQSPKAYVAAIDPSTANTANVALVARDSISLKKDIKIGNTQYNFAANLSANINCTLANAFTFQAFSTYPIRTVLVTNGGGGISAIPTVSATSLYPNDILGGSNLKNLGILAPIKIVSGGAGYVVNDIIKFTGGTGYGANAKVTSVNATGAIVNVAFIAASGNNYPLGGMGYRSDQLPGITVQSSNVLASNAVLVSTGILGDGANFGLVTDRTGSVTKITVIDGGQDYIATPNVSLRIQDIVVNNVTISMLPTQGDILYQGPNVQFSTYSSVYDSVSLLSPNADPTKSLYRLRVFNYNTNPNTQLNIVVSNTSIFFTPANTAWIAPGATKSVYDQYGVKNYGDGSAKASATFLNGLVLGQGEYLNSKGRLSSFSKLQNEEYNNYTYEIIVEKEIAKYRDILLNLLHPAGTKLIGRYNNYADEAFYFHETSALSTGTNLYYHTGRVASSATISGNFTNKSNNIIQFNNLGTGVNLSSILIANSTYIKLQDGQGQNVSSLIISVNNVSNTATVQDNIWVSFANVAYVSTNVSSNIINITSLTNAYNIINNGVYSNTSYPLIDIVRVGDTVKVQGESNTSVVTSVDFINNLIYVSPVFKTLTNALMSVNRTYTFGGTSGTVDQIKLFGPVGLQYIPELSTESGDSIITEDGKTIILG